MPPVGFHAVGHHGFGDALGLHAFGDLPCQKALGGQVFGLGECALLCEEVVEAFRAEAALRCFRAVPHLFESHTHTVIPAKAGSQLATSDLVAKRDSRLRGNDGVRELLVQTNPEPL